MGLSATNTETILPIQSNTWNKKTIIKCTIATLAYVVVAVAATVFLALALSCSSKAIIVASVVVSVPVLLYSLYSSIKILKKEKEREKLESEIKEFKNLKNESRSLLTKLQDVIERSKKLREENAKTQIVGGIVLTKNTSKPGKEEIEKILKEIDSVKEELQRHIDRLKKIPLTTELIQNYENCKKILREQKIELEKMIKELQKEKDKRQQRADAIARRLEANGT